MGANPHGGNNRSDAAGGGHAHAGAMIYLGGAWPENIATQIFMNNIHGQRINMDLLTPRARATSAATAPISADQRPLVADLEPAIRPRRPACT